MHLSKRAIFVSLFGIIAVGGSIFIAIQDENISRGLQVLKANLPFVEDYKPFTDNQTIETTSETILCLGGDVNLANEMATYIQEGNQPFYGIKSVTEDCDLFVVNLETNVADADVGTKQAKNYAFKAPPFTLKALTEAGIDAVSLANNHTKDYGAAALVDQFKHLNNAEIAYFGAGNNIDEAFEPLILDMGDLKLAFIGLNDAETRIGNATSNVAGSAFLNNQRVIQSLNKARTMADLVVVMPHWGTEHQLKASSRQQQWGRLFVDNGADLVIGAHPHVRQNIEVYKDKKIYYSLGNFMFSGFAWTEEGQKSLLIKVKIKNKQIIDFQDIQLQLNWNGFPSPV